MNYTHDTSLKNPFDSSSLSNNKNIRTADEENKFKDISFKKFNTLYKNLNNKKKNFLDFKNEIKEIEKELCFIENDCEYKHLKTVQHNQEFVKKMNEIKNKTKENNVKYNINYNVKYFSFNDTFIYFCKNLLIICKNNTIIEHEMQDEIIDVILNNNLDSIDYEFKNMYENSNLLIIAFSNFVMFYLIDGTFIKPKLFDLNLKIVVNNIFSIEYFDNINHILLTNKTDKLLYIQNFKWKKAFNKPRNWFKNVRKSIKLINNNVEYKFKNKVYENFIFQLKSKILIINNRPINSNQTIYFYKNDSNNNINFFNQLKISKILKYNSFKMKNNILTELLNSHVVDFTLYNQINFTYLELIFNNLYILKFRLNNNKNVLIADLTNWYYNSGNSFKVNNIDFSSFENHDFYLVSNENLYSFNRINYLSNIGKSENSKNKHVKTIIFNNLTQILSNENINYKEIIHINSDENNLKIILENKTIILKKLNIKNMYFNIFGLLYKKLYHKEELTKLIDFLNQKIYKFGLNYSLIIFGKLINELEQGNNNLYLIDRFFNNTEFLSYKNKENLINLIKIFSYQLGLFNEFHYNLIYEFLLIEKFNHNSIMKENFLLDVFKKNNNNSLQVSSYIESELLRLSINLEKIANKKINNSDININLLQNIIEDLESHLKIYWKNKDKMNWSLNMEFLSNFKILEMLKNYIFKEFYDNEIGDYLPKILQNTLEFLKIFYFLKKKNLMFILNNIIEIEKNLKFIEIFMNPLLELIVKKIYYNLLDKIDNLENLEILDIFMYFLSKEEIDSNKKLFMIINNKDYLEDQLLVKKQIKIEIHFDNILHFLNHFLEKNNLENFIYILKLRIECIENNNEIEKIIEFLILVLIEIDNSLKRENNLTFFEKLKKLMIYIKNISYKNDIDKDNKITFAKYFNKIEIKDLNIVLKTYIELLLNSKNKNLRVKILKFIIKKDSNFILLSDLKTNIDFDDYDVKNNFEIICNSKHSFDNITIIMDLLKKNKKFSNILNFHNLFKNHFYLNKDNNLYNNFKNSKNIILNDISYIFEEKVSINLNNKLLIINGLLLNFDNFDVKENQINSCHNEILLMQKNLKIQKYIKDIFENRINYLEFMKNSNFIENKKIIDKFINYYKYKIKIWDFMIIDRKLITFLINTNYMYGLRNLYREYYIENLNNLNQEYFDDFIEYLEYSSYFNDAKQCFNLKLFFEDEEICEFIDMNINQHLKITNMEECYTFLIKNKLIYPYNILYKVELCVKRFNDKLDFMYKILQKIEKYNFNSYIISQIDISMKSGIEHSKEPEYIFKNGDINNNLVIDPHFMVNILIKEINLNRSKINIFKLFDIYYEITTEFKSSFNENPNEFNISKIVYLDKNIIYLLNIYFDEIKKLIEDFDLPPMKNKKENFIKFTNNYNDIVKLLNNFNHEIIDNKRLLSSNTEYLMLFLLESLTSKLKLIFHSNEYSKINYDLQKN